MVGKLSEPAAVLVLACFGIHTVMGRVFDSPRALNEDKALTLVKNASFSSSEFLVFVLVLNSIVLTF